MKKVLKIGVILMIIMGATLVMPKMETEVLAAGNPGAIFDQIDPSDEDGNASGFLSVVNKILGFLQIASALVAVVMIAVTGFRYIMETPDMKNELKKSMVPIIVGLLLVFFATTIAKFFVNIFQTGDA